MSFGESVSTCLRKYADFNGRASRPEFWWFVLAIWLIQAVLFLIAVSGMRDRGAGDGMPAFFFLAMIFSLAVLLPYLAALVRRLHDTNRSGAYFFVAFIPLVGGIILLIFLASEGTAGQNAYGPPPGAAPPPPPL